MKRTWSDNDLKILRENYPEQPNFHLVKLLPGKTPKAINQKAKKLKIRKNKDFKIIRKWNEEMDNKLKYLYKDYTASEISGLLNMTQCSIKCRVNILGLHKEENKGRFIKGQIPRNKGKKMDPELKAKMSHTWFKKGHTPGNSKYFGKPFYKEIMMNGKNEKLWLIRINGIQKGYMSYLCRKHRIDLKGKIPRLKPGFNHTKPPTIDDIEVITYQENMSRNTIHNYPEDLRKLIYIKGIFKRQIKKAYEQRNNIG